MKHGLWLIFVALAMIAATVLFRYDPEPVAAIESTPVPAKPAAAVRVSHEFVTVKIPAAATRHPRQPSVSRSQTLLASHGGTGSIGRREALKASNRETTASRDGNLLEKAGRALVGDGKYRPEPFPRIR